MRDVYIITHSL